MLSDVYFPRVNGVSTSIRTFAQALARMGHAVTLVVPDYGVPDHGMPGPAGDGDEDAVEFEIIRLPSRVIFFDPEDRLIRASALRRVLPRLAARHWDVIHIHTPFRAHRLGVRLSQVERLPDGRDLPHLFRGIRRPLPAVGARAVAALDRAARVAVPVPRRRPPDRAQHADGRGAGSLRHHHAIDGDPDRHRPGRVRRRRRRALSHGARHRRTASDAGHRQPAGGGEEHRLPAAR